MYAAEIDLVWVEQAMLRSADDYLGRNGSYDMVTADSRTSLSNTKPDLSRKDFGDRILRVEEKRFTK